MCLAFVGFQRWFHYNPRRTTFFPIIGKIGLFFQPLENFFQSLENGRSGDEPADCVRACGAREKVKG
jgi:hypothetical protein